MTIKLPSLPFSLPKQLPWKKGKEEIEQKVNIFQDAGVAVAFVGAISVLLLAAGYVISRLAKERAYREKWKDYNDCGWA